MTDIKTIPLNELKKDLEDSYSDLMTCEAALTLGITKHHGDIAERADANRGFIKVITAELKRREQPCEPSGEE